MGEQDVLQSSDADGLRDFMTALLTDLRALERMIQSGLIETGIRRIGAEQEMFLVDAAGQPARLALEVLEEVDDDHFTTELGRFNLEVNLDPQVFEGNVLRRLEDDLVRRMDQIREAARRRGAEVCLTGILPTLGKSDLGLDSMTPMPRYRALNRVLTELRGGPYDFRISGVDELSVTHDNVMVEACNCSFQLHFQVGAEEFANLYNCAQAVTAPVLAAASNSPLLFGRRLWRETRIAVFQQSIDTRSTSQHLRDRSPRVTFGNDWVRESVLELFREDITRFRTVFGMRFDESPLAELERGEIPKLSALRLHNGTVYRWNRPCYGVTDGKPHLRIENRILPAGPTPRDEIANAAFWFGLISGLSHKYERIADHMSFKAARGNFRQAARYGLAAGLEWIGGESIQARELILEELVPLAREGLEAKDVDRDDIDLYLGVIRNRVGSGQTGCQWLVRSLSEMRPSATESSRLSALVRGTIQRQATNRPVHEWDLARQEESADWKSSFRRVEQIMTTDLFTVRKDEPLELVAQIMDWQRIRHIPVEDQKHQLVGLLSYRTILRVLASARSGSEGRNRAVSTVMRRELITVSPGTPTLEALRLMRRHSIGCLPVVEDGCLVGVVTERDFMDVAGSLMEEQLGEKETDGVVAGTDGETEVGEAGDRDRESREPEGDESA